MRKAVPHDWKHYFALARAEGNALIFATRVLGFLMPGAPNLTNAPQLEPWQVEALKRFSRAFRNRFKKPGRLSIRSGHGVGKTTFLSIILVFTLLVGGNDVRVPVVANSLDQLRDGLWPEINKWLNKLPNELRPQITWNAEKIHLTNAPEGVFAVRRTASKHRPEALQGIHADTVLALFEEASGIPEETIEAGAGSLSTPGAMAVAAGNPTRRSGFFWRTHADPAMRAEWETMVVNSEDVPRARGHIQTIINLYGKDSNKYRVRVLGQFPDKDDDTVIPLSWCEAAKVRKVVMSHVFPVWGLDVARFGDDRIVLMKRQGNSLLAPPIVWRNLKTTQIVGRVVSAYIATPNDMKPRAICVDVLNMGAGVVDGLRDDPTLVAEEVNVVAVNVAENPANGELNHRLRDELWFDARDWFAGNDVSLRLEHLNPEEQALIEELIGELTTPTYDLTQSGKRVVMTKADMKKDIGRSPDIADAFNNTFACPVYPRPVEDYDRHRSRRWDRDDIDPLAA